jgi:hypothetical protein
MTSTRIMFLQFDQVFEEDVTGYQLAVGVTRYCKKVKMREVLDFPLKAVRS